MRMWARNLEVMSGFNPLKVFIKVCFNMFSVASGVAVYS